MALINYTCHQPASSNS